MQKKCKIILSELSRLLRTRGQRICRPHHHEDKKEGKYNHTIHWNLIRLHYEII